MPAAHTLGALRAAAAKCRGCDLWKRGTQTVFGEGRASARVVLVGEQPGHEEDVPVVSVIDGHSHTLAFLGGALGVSQLALGVDDFGQSGTRPDLYRHYGIDANAIVAAAEAIAPGRPIRYLKALP